MVLQTLSMGSNGHILCILNLQFLLHLLALTYSITSQKEITGASLPTLPVAKDFCEETENLFSSADTESAILCPTPISIFPLLLPCPMIGYFLPNGRNVIWGVPEPPMDPDFRNISFDDPHDGIYLFGQNIFPTRPITITRITNRNLTGNAEEFLLGVLSVLLIALLSEIVQAILMCTRQARRPSQKGVKMAFLVDEFYHFRNVSSHLFGRVTKRKAPRLDPERKRRVVTSLTIVLIALGLMAADVFAVYLTQPIAVTSENYQYNIRGVTPTFANQGLGRFVKRLTTERPCVTPTFIQEGQERMYTLSACTTIDRDRRHGDNITFEGNVTVSSYFHKAGADHNITFGDSLANSRVTIKSRTVMYVSEGPTYRILYDVIEKDDFKFTKHLHTLFIYSVMEFSCNRRNTSGKGKKKFANTWCDEIVERHELVDQRVVKRNIVFWTKRDNKEEEAEVRGVVSTYNLRLERVWESIDSGISPLTTTSQLEEVEERGGQYVNITNEAFRDNLDGLLEEEGRVAGLMVLVIAFSVFTVTLVLLRFLLRPLSLGAMAWEARQKMDDSDLEEKDEVVGGTSSSTSINFEPDMMSHSTLEHDIESHNVAQAHSSALDRHRTRRQDDDDDDDETYA